MIDTATNTVVAPVPVGTGPLGVAVTPDGKHAYVTNVTSNNVSVIDTASNTVVATVPVGTRPGGVGIVPPPPGVPFLAFRRQARDRTSDRAPNQDAFALADQLHLEQHRQHGINPVTEPVTLQVGTFTATIPPGSFKKTRPGLSSSRGSSMA